jgi:hypothetical protein
MATQAERQQRADAEAQRLTDKKAQVLALLKTKLDEAGIVYNPYGVPDSGMLLTERGRVYISIRSAYVGGTRYKYNRVRDTAIFIGSKTHGYTDRHGKGFDWTKLIATLKETIENHVATKEREVKADEQRARVQANDAHIHEYYKLTPVEYGGSWRQSDLGLAIKSGLHIESNGAESTLYYLSFRAEKLTREELDAIVSALLPYAPNKAKE